MDKLAIISLKYLEPYYKDTLACLKKQPYPVFYADRHGVGNMSKAFNDTFLKDVAGKFQYVWFITNITFDPDAPAKLVSILEQWPDIACIHPEFDSDHQHIRPDGSNDIKEIPFTELTAPMFRADVFDRLLLNEDHWYWYMDLIISHEMKEAGYKIACHHGVKLGHAYLRNNKSHPISEIRNKLREYRAVVEKQILIDEYGENWKDIIWKH